MSSGGVAQSQGACGGQTEEAEDEESSSSSSSSSTIVEDELENFRQKWKHDIASGTTGSKSSESANLESEEFATVEEKARKYFLEGVEHEENGEFFEAIKNYRKAMALVPDIEFKAFEHNLRRRATATKDTEQDDQAASDEDIEDIEDFIESPLEDSEDDLLMKFSRLKLKSHHSGLCEPEETTNLAHISRLPMEVLIHILKWVVSSELDLKSLETFSQVCRGFFVAARASDIWRRICIQTWGLAGLPMEEPGLGGWRTLFLTRPRVNFNGCYISRVTYLREGERGFQDNEFYKSWHMVSYYRILRYFPGGQVLMVTTAEDPSVAVKMLNSRYSCAIQGCMFGHYRTMNNRIHCVLQKTKNTSSASNNRRSSLRQRKSRNPYVFEVPEQDFHMELEISGKRNQQLQWLWYNVISKYKNGREQISSIDVSNPNNYPTMHFSRVKSYTLETLQPLI